MSIDPRNDAKHRFFHMDGHGAGAKYWDTKTRQVVTAINVADWISKQGAEVKPSFIGSQAWPSVTPHKRFKLKGPPIIEEHGIRSVNSWYDDGVDASKYRECTAEEITANAQPFVSLLELVINRSENGYADVDGRVQYFTDWLRYVFQNPGAKPPVAPYTFGPHGYFKSTVMNTLADAFGQNTARIADQDKEVLDKNSFELMQSALVMVEEVRPSSHDGTDVYNALKAAITGKAKFAAAKHKGYEQRETPASLWLSSNHEPPFLEEGDRRFWVIQWGEAPTELMDTFEDADEYAEFILEWKSQVFREYRQWLDEEDGLAKVRAYLEYVPSQFRPTDAPMTPEKRTAMGIALRPEVYALRELLEDNEDVVIWTADDLMTLLNLDKESQVKHIAQEAGLKGDVLQNYSDAKRPELKRGSTTIRGKKAFFRRPDHKLASNDGKWRITPPTGQPLEVEEQHLSGSVMAL